MIRKNFAVLGILFLILVFLAKSFAQGTTGSIAGTVTDSNGAVVPNATIVVKGSGGQEFTATTNDNGGFQIPAVQNGLYSVTVTLAGFKKSVTNNVKVDVGTPTTVDVKLETGDVSAVVEVVDGGEVLQTQTTAVSTTLREQQILKTPLTSRDSLDLVTLMPGTAQVGRPRQSSVNGLPKGSLAITIDGVDVQDQTLKSSDGFFTYIRPRLDAIEEVSVQTAAGGSEVGGDGAVQIKFVTKRGTNQYRGNLFWQHRDESLNSNYWFNNQQGLPRNKIRLNQYGGNFGGYIPFIPNFGEGGPMFVSGKDKAFFFVNYEEFRIPESINRTRTILTPDAAAGIFRYGSGQSVNLLQIAAANGLPSTLDPTIGSLNSAIRAATNQGTITSSGNLNTQFFNWIPQTSQKRTFLTMRFDVNLGKNHSIENVYNRNIFGGPAGGFALLNNADPSFPGFPNFGDQTSQRYSNSTALRSTLSDNLVNEARFATLWGDSQFFAFINAGQFTNQGGYNLVFGGSNPTGTPAPIFGGLTNITAGLPDAFGRSTTGIGPNSRFTPTYDFTDNLTWVRGNHTMSFGGQYKRIVLETGATPRVVPDIFFGIDSTSDPAENVFTRTGAGATLPGATAAELATAKALYALLTGRVTDVVGTAYLGGDGQYIYLGSQFNRATQNTYGLYAQDSWRIRPNLTLNFGLRWQPQEAFVTGTPNYSAASNFADVYGVSGEGNLFKPGTLTGRVPTFKVVDTGYRAYDNDYNNFGPSVGIIYSPNTGDGLLKTILGASGKSVLRAGYSRSFVREGQNVLLSILTSNPGSSLDASRNVSAGTLTAGTLFRNIGSVSVPSFPATPPGVLVGTVNDATNVFDPNLRTGYVDSWNVGYQRELDKKTRIEIRYVGNRGRDLWRQYNINETNVTENGFAGEFKLAQANLAANNAAGGARAGSFAYFGANTGTSPLPIMQAYFSAVPTNTTAAYTSALYRNATLINNLNSLVPTAVTFAQTLDGNAGLRLNAQNAGLPANFFVVNPTTRGGAFIVDNSTKTGYDALQIELHRSLSNGLLVAGSYTFSKSLTNAFASSSLVARDFRSLRNRDLDNTISPFDVTHAFKLNWVYDLPFGRGGMFFSNANRFVDALIGGWGINGAFKLQSGTPINFGNVNLVGMTRKDLEQAVRKIYYDQSVVYNGAAPVKVPASYLPTDIIQNTNLAFNNQTFTGRAITPATYGGCVQEYTGQCGFSQLIVHGPRFVRLDMTLQKAFRIDERRNVTLAAAFYNALNNAQFRVGGWAADNVTVTGLGGTAFGRYTSNPATVYQDTSTTNDQGGRTIELILRINF